MQIVDGAGELPDLFLLKKLGLVDENAIHLSLFQAEFNLYKQVLINTKGISWLGYADP